MLLKSLSTGEKKCPTINIDILTNCLCNIMIDLLDKLSGSILGLVSGFSNKI